MAKLLSSLDFSRGIKIEVGSGGNPQHGYVHVDVDASMPHLEAVCEMGKEELPFPAECADELLSNHSIEHVKWVDLDFLIKDWFRVLKPGGKLFLRTPDFEFICKMYLERKTTKEHPVDESNMVRIFGDYGPWHWATIKLFAGQNYSGNTHFFDFDWETLHSFLTRYGFQDIQRLYDQPVFSPGEICCVAYKRHSSKIYKAFIF